MKRRAPSSPAAADQEGPRRRRQPQISCNFCRSKKLKCDRAQPCSNCTSRGIPCDGQSLSAVPPPTVNASPVVVTASPDVLERLRRLEEAIFGSASAPSSSSAAAATATAAADTPFNHPSHSSRHDTPRSSYARPLVVRRESSPDLDYNDAHDSPVFDDSVSFTFRVMGVGEFSNAKHTTVNCIDLPSRDDAFGLLHDYLDSSDFHVVNVLHAPSIQAMMAELYNQLRQGQKIDGGSAALVLSICAASAFFWDADLPTHTNFLSEDQAAAQSYAWRTASWDLLDQTQRSAVNSVDAIQARMVLADLLYNMEGASSRFRYLNSCARAAAIELKMNVIDLPGLDSTDGLLLREVKRRIWWHLVGTDWLLCNMGGPMDRVYSVHPNHMRVNRPRHIPDSDAFKQDRLSETAVMHMNARIRIAEICREVADTLPLGSGEADILPYPKIAALDRMFEDIIDEWPVLNVDLSTADNDVRKVAIQRLIGLLSIHARRARFLRPLLRVKDLAPMFEGFRKTCLASVETVMETASMVLSQAVDTPKSTNSDGSAKLTTGSTSSTHTPYRSGLIINHLFMACAVIATDPSLRGGDDGTASGSDPDTERRRAQLADACRLLEKTGERIPMALGMVKRLVLVLRRHRVHGVEEERGSPRSERQPQKTFESGINPGQGTTHQQIQPSGAQQLAVAYPPGSVVGGEQQQQQQQQPQEATTASNWAYNSMDPNSVTGIWNDFLGTNPTDNGWDQLFADLDYITYGM